MSDTPTKHLPKNSYEDGLFEEVRQRFPLLTPMSKKRLLDFLRKLETVKE